MRELEEIEKDLDDWKDGLTDFLKRNRSNPTEALLIHEFGPRLELFADLFSEVLRGLEEPTETTEADKAAALIDTPNGPQPAYVPLPYELVRTIEGVLTGALPWIGNNPQMLKLWIDLEKELTGKSEDELLQTKDQMLALADSSQTKELLTMIQSITGPDPILQALTGAEPGKPGLHLIRKPDQEQEPPKE